jgi:hypothetical protein
LFISCPPLLEYLPDERMLPGPQGIELALSKNVRINGYFGRGDTLGQLGGSV